MVDKVVFTSPETTGEAPQTPPVAAPESNAPANVEKALADTKAELTRVQQELAALKKAPADAPTDAPATAPEGQATDTPAEPKPGEEPKADAGETPEQKAAADAVKAAGLDVSPWQAEFESTGNVSEEGRAKIAEGLKSLFGEDARRVVDQFIDDRKVVLANQEAELMKAGGGPDGYKEMIAWAAKSLPKAEADLFDATVSSGDVNAALFAIRGLRSRFEAENGKRPSLISGNVAPATDDAGFASRAEMTAAIADPRYAKDPAYRSRIEQRILKSSF